MLSVLLGAVVSLAISEINTNLEKDYYLFKLLFCSLLEIPLFFSFSLFAEKKGYKKTSTALIQLVGIIILAAYYSILSDSSETLNITRLIQLNLCLHLLGAFARS